MKTQINEVKRMQLLAGIINESQINEEQEVSPEQAIQKVMPLASKLENSPELDKVAQKIAKDPALIAQLEKALAQGGVQTDLNEVENELDANDMKTLMLKFAEKGEQIKERISNDADADTSSAGLSMASVLGGGVLGSLLKGDVLAAVPAAASIFAGPAVVGAAAGLALFLIARKVYLIANPDA